MNLAFDLDDERFRYEVRSFIADVVPKASLEPTATERNRWEQALINRGWQAYKWPAAFGGTGWSLAQKYIWETETGTRGLATQISGSGVSMIGPILCGYGTDAQCARYLPSILDGTEQWCQGYSEPGAGSDLASLTTRGDREQNHYRVSGHKLWTSGAHHSQMMFCLVRTRHDGPKQAGITFLLIDMRAPGIEVTPIISIDGMHSLNAVRLDNVQVPFAQRIGEENQGWTYAKGLLTHERTGLAFITESLRKLEILKLGLQTCDLTDDLALARKVADIETELQALIVSELRALAQSVNGQPGVESSFLKLKGTYIVQRLTELLMECAGHWAIPYSLTDRELPDDRIGPHFCQETVQQYLIARSASIAGGSDEIQRNIIAKHVLGLTSK